MSQQDSGSFDRVIYLFGEYLVIRKTRFVMIASLFQMFETHGGSVQQGCTYTCCDRRSSIRKVCSSDIGLGFLRPPPFDSSRVYHISLSFHFFSLCFESISAYMSLEINKVNQILYACMKWDHMK